MLEEFLRLARYSPIDLILTIRERRLHPVDLSYALEALGYIKDYTRALPILFEALEDENPLIRAGAVHGLSVYLDDDSIRHWLEKVGATDSSEDVREAVFDNL